MVVDLRVQQTVLEFRVAGPYDGEVSYDNLQDPPLE
jgi:hypothetical protein